MDETEAAAALQRLIATEEIKRLKARYFRYVDQQDWDAFSSLFWADAHFELGAGSFDGVGPMIEHVRGLLDGGTTFHHGHMPEIDVTGPDDATAIWTLFDRVEPLAKTGRKPFYGYARYWETYRRFDDGWKITSLKIERLRIVETAAGG